MSCLRFVRERTRSRPQMRWRIRGVGGFDRRLREPVVFAVSEESDDVIFLREESESPRNGDPVESRSIKFGGIDCETESPVL